IIAHRVPLCVQHDIYRFSIWICEPKRTVPGIGVLIPVLGLRQKRVELRSLTEPENRVEWIGSLESTQGTAEVAFPKVIQPVFAIPFFAGELVGTMHTQGHAVVRTVHGVVGAGLAATGARSP